MLDLAVEHIKGLQSELQVIYIRVHVYECLVFLFFFFSRLEYIHCSEDECVSVSTDHSRRVFLTAHKLKAI